MPAPLSDVATQHLVAMRDGVRLATDVYLPRAGTSTSEPGALPTILVRLPYDKNSRYVFMEAIAQRFNAAGYAMVVQDVRGKFRSEGHPLGPTSEVNDGYDTLDWISKQTWSDGKVGMFGDSYYGFTQWAALSSAHPALKAMVPRVTSTNVAGFITEPRGPVSDVPWLTAAKYVAQCWAGPYIVEDPIDWETTPLVEAFETYFQAHGERAPWYDLMVPRRIPVEVYPNGHPYQARPVPTLHCVGWYDNLLIAHMRDYMHFAGSAANPVHYLLADSTDHENYHLDQAPVAAELDHDQNDEALDAMLAEYVGPAIEFFDVFIRELAPDSTIPRVRWHLGNAGPRVSQTWPPQEARERHLYLTSPSDQTSGPAADASLSWTEPEAASEWNWSYNPTNLVRSTVENSFAQIFEYPDESATARHPDVMVFESEVTAEPVDLAGPVDLMVRVASTAPSADVHAKLGDVAPDGRVSLIARGQAVLTEPREDVLCRVEMGHTGYRLLPGHRFQLQVSSSDYPEFVPNSGSSENRWLVDERRSSNQRLLTDVSAPSRVVLHVLSGGSSNES